MLAAAASRLTHSPSIALLFPPGIRCRTSQLVFRSRPSCAKSSCIRRCARPCLAPRTGADRAATLAVCLLLATPGRLQLIVRMGESPRHAAQSARRHARPGLAQGPEADRADDAAAASLQSRRRVERRPQGALGAARSNSSSASPIASTNTRWPSSRTSRPRNRRCCPKCSTRAGRWSSTARR